MPRDGLRPRTDFEARRLTNLLFPQRGPEVELCFADEGSNPVIENDWSLLPFMALSDGAHTYDNSDPRYTSRIVRLRADFCSTKQIDRGLLLLHTSTRSNLHARRDVPVWDLLHTADPIQPIGLSPARRDQIHGAEGRCRRDGWAATFRNIAREVVDGDIRVVCPKVWILDLPTVLG